MSPDVIIRWLRAGALSLGLAMLTQLVVHAVDFSHDDRFLQLLEERALASWVLAALWLGVIAVRRRLDEAGTDALVARRLPHAIATGALLVCVVSPFANAYFTHLTHPVLALCIAWAIWPGLEWVWARARGGVVLRAWIMPLASAVAVAAVVFMQSFRRHWWFGSGGKDLGLFHQSVWLLSRFESPDNTVMGMNAFADHLEFVDLLAAPLQWVWPSAGALLLFQALAIGAGAAAIYDLARRKIGSDLAGWALAAVYLLCIDVQSAVMFDWNPTTVGAGFLPWVVWFFERERLIGFGLTLGLVALCKENLVLYALGLCLALAYDKRRRPALAAAAVLAVWFVVELKVIFPIFRTEGFRHLRFEGMGDGFLAMLGSLVQSPHRALALMFTPGAKINGLLAPFSSVAFACWLAPRYAWAFLPPLLERFWSTHQNRWWGHHYGAGIGVIAVVAAIEGLRRLGGWVSAEARGRVLGVATTAVLLSCVLVGTLGRFGTGPLWVWRASYYAGEVDRENTAAVIARIPEDADVAAQNHLLPHLSARRHIRQIEPPINERFVALNLKQSAWPFGPKYAERLAHALLARGYGIVACEGAALLLERDAASMACPALE